MKSFWLVITVLLLPVSVLGDDLSDYGELVSVETLGERSDQYLILRGRATLRVDDIDTVYTWGGSTCGNDGDLRDAQLTQLQNALLAPYMRVRFRTKPGQGAALCVTGFEITNEKFLTS